MTLLPGDERLKDIFSLERASFELRAHASATCSASLCLSSSPILSQLLSQLAIQLDGWAVG